MPKALQIIIPRPCHENWHNMTPNEQGRFCGSCQKTVVDFTAMSDKELLSYISNAAGGHNCGRFSNDQLNVEIKTPENRRRFGWAYIWNILLVTFLVTESYGQEEPQIKQKPEVHLPDLSPTRGSLAVKEPDTLPAMRQIRGVVKDSNSQKPLPGAHIRIKGSSIVTSADMEGVFMLKVENKDIVTLEVTYVGYEKQMVLINKINGPNVNVLMTEAVMGDFIIVPHFTFKQKVKRFCRKVVAPFRKNTKVKSEPV